MMGLSFRRPLVYTFVASVMCSLCLIYTTSFVQAAPRQSYSADLLHVVTNNASVEGHVTILILDMSGSMAQNDPDGLRCSAANAYIDLSGPGSLIGVIGLDNNDGKTTGAHSFQQAQLWADPVEMSTLRVRQGLQQTIAQKSQGCKPDATTPTYDALDKSLTMLNNATQGGKLSGSVILLTDGAPCNGNLCSDTTQQIDAIRSELIPQFQSNHWPIDTIALGTDGPIPGTNNTFHQFLSSLSSSTSGSFYDDGHGVVPGISPLNIAQFFVDIFGKRNKRTVNNDIPPTTLNGGTTSRDFDVTDYTQNLDVVVVKDQSATRATLLTPNGHIIAQISAGVFVSSADPHYVIFSIKNPQKGTWSLNVSGSGQFLMDSLKTSDIGISIPQVTLEDTSAPTGSALPLGQPIIVTAALTSAGQPVTNDSFTLTGTITYTGALGNYTQNFTMDDKASPGTYTVKLNIPETAPPGSYDIQINASTVSLAAIIASTKVTVPVQLFPEPFFLSPLNGQPTKDAVDTTVIQWPVPFQLLYSIPGIDHLSGWPLQNYPARPNANVLGQVELQGKSYSSANVTGSAVLDGSKDPINVTIINDGNGRFHVLFPPSANGGYTVTFRTSGAFEVSHGYFGATIRKVHVIIVPAVPGMVFNASWKTGVYLLLLIFLIFLLRYIIMPKPSGEWVRVQNASIVGRGRFSRVHRNPLQALLHPDLIQSRQANMPRGLLIRFKYGHGIESQPDGNAGRAWRSSDGSNLRPQFLEMTELMYRPDSDDEDDEASNYLIVAQSKKRNMHEEGASSNFYDDDERSTQRKRKGKASDSSRYSEDSYNEDSSRKRNSSRRGKQSYSDDTYDY